MGRVLEFDGDDFDAGEHHQQSRPDSSTADDANDRHDGDENSGRSIDSNANRDNDTAESNESLRLDHFLKLCGAAMTGGHAKLMIQSGEVTVDGQVETRRRRKLKAGQKVGCGGDIFDVA